MSFKRVKAKLEFSIDLGTQEIVGQWLRERTLGFWFKGR